ncbi:MAG: hypothetical protein ACRYFU_12425 [Janthinobacterium lividum]
MGASTPSKKLAVLPRASLMDVLGVNAQAIRIGYRPDPAFIPQPMEERLCTE